MNAYWHYVHASPPPGRPPAMVSTPPLATYYSPRVPGYAEVRVRPDEYEYEYSPRGYYRDIDHHEISPRRDYFDSPADSSRDSSPQPPPQVPRESTPRAVTAQDRADAGIPAGYSTKNWDPAEEPIFLLGSVFDANSLGKWIYDWTVYHHGPGTDELAVAGDLWLALIALAGKMRQAEYLLHKKQRGLAGYKNGASKRKLIEDFLDDGDELWDRFRALLKACERSMMRVARRNRETGQVAMGKSSGCEFVDCIFGEGRGLEETEDLINTMVSWDKRFDATFKKGRRRRPA
ncbi:MAG: alcohol dehydrogenase [Watsoniomyces obsoletus]|nr:MAG: alcohol dehydrogenase [Watsoniomyces obsoletus]